MTYMDATKAVVEHIIEAAVFPAKLLTLPIFALSWQEIGHAKNEFPIHTKSMLENERKLQEESPELRSNLMSLLVRLSDSSKVNESLEVKTDEGSKPQVILEEEILGNLRGRTTKRRNPRFTSPPVQPFLATVLHNTDHS